MIKKLGNMYRRRAVGLDEAPKEAGIPRAVLQDRVFRGMTLAEAVALGTDETHRTWRFTLLDGSRLDHETLVSTAYGEGVSVVQLIEELEEGYWDGGTLQEAVARSTAQPWPLPDRLSDARTACLVGMHPDTLRLRLRKIPPTDDYRVASDAERTARMAPVRIHGARSPALRTSDIAAELHVTEEEVWQLYDALQKRRQLGHTEAGIMTTMLGIEVVPHPEDMDDRGFFALNPGSPLWGGRVNVKALARQAKLNHNTLRWRLRNGWDLREALLTPAGTQGGGSNRKRKGPEEEWPLDTPEGQRAQRDRAGLTAKIVWDRVNNGWDRDAALTAPKGARRTRSHNISELAREHGLGPETVRARMKKGWSLEEALGTPPLRKHKPKPKPVLDSADAAQSENPGS